MWEENDSQAQPKVVRVLMIFIHGKNVINTDIVSVETGLSVAQDSLSLKESVFSKSELMHAVILLWFG